MASNANKAVIVFTDGQNTSGGVSIDELIGNARSKNIQLHTVGLSQGVNKNVLARMAGETEGAFIFASDALQLITAFGTLGDLLSGTGQIYTVAWEASRPSSWGNNVHIGNSVLVSIPGSTDPIELPFLINIE